MANLFRNRAGVLIGAAVLALTLWTQSARAETLLDAALADVNGRFLAASDVAIARALSLFGEQPSSGHILRAEVDRLENAWLIDEEARQLRMGGTPQETDSAWQEAANRAGGLPLLEQWMREQDLDPTVVRELVRSDLRWRRYIDLRFRALVFLTDEDIDKALGPGAHSPQARQAAADRLRQDAADRDLSQWLTEARQRSTIRSAEVPTDGIPLPFGPPRPF
jgi:hypothetical protein